MKTRNGSMSYWLLFALEKAIDGTVQLDDFIYNTYKYTGGSNIGPGLKKSSLSVAVRRLREKGLIKNELNEGKILLKLTGLGQEHLDDKKEAEWDGKYRIVIWDIPEKNRTVRNLLRRRLKDWGFKSWQKSVWITKKNVTVKLRQLISELGVEDMVVVIESNDSTLSNIQIDDRPH